MPPGRWFGSETAEGPFEHIGSMFISRIGTSISEFLVDPSHAQLRAQEVESGTPCHCRGAFK